MTKESERLKTLARGISEKPKTVTPKKVNLPALEANPAHGEKGDFLKVTATLSPEVYRLLAEEMTRRRLAKEPNAQLSAILREAVVAYLVGAPTLLARVKGDLVQAEAALARAEGKAR